MTVKKFTLEWHAAKLKHYEDKRSVAYELGQTVTGVLFDNMAKYHSHMVERYTLAKADIDRRAERSNMSKEDKVLMNRYDFYMLRFHETGILGHKRIAEYYFEKAHDKEKKAA